MEFRYSRYLLHRKSDSTKSRGRLFQHCYELLRIVPERGFSNYCLTPISWISQMQLNSLLHAHRQYTVDDNFEFRQV